MSVSSQQWVKESFDLKQHALSFNSMHYEIQPGLVISLLNGSIERSDPVVLDGDQDFIHFTYVIEGRFSASLGNTKLSLTNEDFCFGFSDGEPFRIRDKQQFRLLEIMVAPQLLERLASELYPALKQSQYMSFFVEQSLVNHTIVNLVNRIAQCASAPDENHLLLHSAAYEFLHWTLNTLRESKYNSVTVREKYQLRQARDILLSDLSKAPTIAAIAREIGLNEFKLKRGFRQLFQSSIYDYFQKHRMEYAQQLLSRHSVTDTAFTVGYSNISHFSNAFKKVHGLLPSQMKKELRQIKV